VQILVVNLHFFVALSSVRISYSSAESTTDIPPLSSSLHIVPNPHKKYPKLCENFPRPFLKKLRLFLHETAQSLYQLKREKRSKDSMYICVSYFSVSFTLFISEGSRFFICFMQNQLNRLKASSIN
jgi:hypothetical protein